MLVQGYSGYSSSALLSQLRKTAQSTRYQDLAANNKAGSDLGEASIGATAADSQSAAARETLLKELRDYIDKGPIVAMREKILKSMGLTEEELKALPPEAQQQIEAEIAEKIKEALLKQHEETTAQQGTLQKLAMYSSNVLEASATAGKRSDYSV